MTLTPSKIKSPLIFILCLAITIAIYYPGLSGDFYFDDFPNIIDNKNLHIDNLDTDSLIGASLSSDSGRLKRPVSMFSFALNSHFYGRNPFSFKVTNLIIHLLHGIAIYLLTSLIFYSYKKYRRPELPDSILFFLPLIISTLWLIHPLNLTGVLYVVQRMTSLASLFTTLGVCCYIWFRIRMLEHKKGFWLIPGTVVIFGSLAIFSKESGALLPLFMLITELTLFRFRNHNGCLDKTITSLFVVVFLLPLTAVMLLLLINPDNLLSSYAIREFTLLERLMTEARVMLFYLKMIILPSINELGLYHDDIIISRSLFDPVDTIPSIIGILSLFILGVSLIAKQPLISFGILWFFSGHALESTFIPLEIAHEHRNYLADYGIILSICCLFTIPALNFIKLPVRAVIAIAALALLGFVTTIRAQQWGDPMLQPVYEARHHPNSARATLSAARIYSVLTLSGHADHADSAIMMYEKSRALDKYGISANISLIILHSKLNRSIKPEWVEDLNYKLSSYPIVANTRSSLMDLVRCQGKECKLSKLDMDTIFKHALSNSLHNDKGLSDPNIVTIYAEYIINNKKDFRTGKSLFMEAVRIAPREPQYRINLINLLLITKDYNEARKQIEFLKEINTSGKLNHTINIIENDLKIFMKENINQIITTN